MKKLADKRHWYLYAKYHYKETNIVEDLKKIQSDYCGIEPEHIRIGDLCSVAQHLAWKYIKTNDHLFDQFMEQIDPDRDKWFTGKSDPAPHHERVLNACMFVLRYLNVDKIEGELGEADPKILPFSDDKVANLREKREAKTKEYLSKKKKSYSPFEDTEDYHKSFA